MSCREELTQPRVAIRDFGTSLSFGANSTDNVDCGAVDFLGTGDVTISAWIKPKGWGGGNYGRIIDNAKLLIFIDAGKIKMISDGLTNSDSILNSIDLNVWQFITVTRESDGTAAFYVNNIDRSSTTNSGTPVAGTTNVFIGNNGANARNFDGNIEELRVYNSILTVQEINDLYYNNTVPQTGLVAEYLLEEGAGAVANDTSGNGNDGTITGATWSSDTPSKARKEVNGNLVKNGDFEYAPPFVAAMTAQQRWIDGSAAGSTTNDLFDVAVISADGTYESSFDNTEKNSGNNSLKMSIDTGAYVQTWIAPTSNAAMIQKYGIPVKPSTAYSLTVWVKTNAISGSSSGAKFGIIEKNANNDTPSGGSHATTSVGVTTDWTKYEINFTTNAATRFIGYQCHLLGNNGDSDLAMDAWFDDIVLKPTTPTTRTVATGRTAIVC